MVAEIKKRHLFCCCTCGFILGIASVIGGITGLVIYFGNGLFNSFNTPVNDTLKDIRGGCPQYWSSYKENCYHFSRYNLSWNDAQENCTSVSSSLTDVDDEDEARWLARAAEKYTDSDLWIGGKGTNRGDFKWFSADSSPRDINFTYWAPGQPSFPQQDCIQMWREQKYKWANELCSKMRKFICKRNKG